MPKRDDNNMLYTLLENGQLLGLLYNSRENINGWFPTETAGTVKSMATVTRPDGKDDLFICVERSGVHYLEKMSAEAEFSKFYESPHFLTDARKEYYNRIIAEELKQCNYLDCSTRFFGVAEYRNFGRRKHCDGGRRVFGGCAFWALYRL